MIKASVAFPSVEATESGARFKVVLPDGLIVTVEVSKAEALNLSAELRESQGDAHAKEK